MKTFLYSIPNKIQSFSRKLDVKAALCGKSWEVFNDEGVKQLFIFNEDGSILITNNGKVFNASWKYIPQNSSILISTGDETIMFRPAFFNKDVFALQQDGVEQYLLMVDEEKKTSFPNLSLDALVGYIEKEIEPQRDDKPKQYTDTGLADEKCREDERLDLKEEEKKALIRYMAEHKNEIDCILDKRRKRGTIGSIVCAIVLFSVWLIPNAEFAVCFSMVSLVVGLAFFVQRYSSPIDIINTCFENGVRYHNDEEVRKLFYEKL